ncbi:DNA repair and recombination protein RAD54B, partial [Taenia solium]
QSDSSAKINVTTLSISSPDERKSVILQRQVFHPIPSNIESEVHNNGQRYEIVFAKRSTKKVLMSKFARPKAKTTRLHPYQLEGIKFLYECVLGYRRIENQHFIHSEVINESVGDEPRDIYGGILADEMGLGKTVQVIGLLSILLKQGPYGGQPVVRRCLIVTPGSLVTMKPPPVIILSYEMLLQHANRIAEIASLDLLVCDEGHRLKNLEIKTTAVLKRLPARRRIILTGTPIQNDLNEFWSLAEFVAPGCLASSREEYRTRIVNPLSKSLHSTELFKAIASTDAQMPAELVTESVEILEAVQRLKTALRMFMLLEQIVFCEASSLQRELEAVLLSWIRNQLDCNVEVEMKFIDMVEEDSSEPSSFENGIDILACIMAFRKLYNHPSLLLESLNEYSKKKCGLASAKKIVLPVIGLVGVNEGRMQAEMPIGGGRVERPTGKDLANVLDAYTHTYTRYLVSGGVKECLILRFIARSNDGLVDSLLSILQRDLPPTERSGCSSPFCLTSGKLAVLQRLLVSISQMHTDSPSLGGIHRLVLVSNFTQTLDLLEPICRSITKSPCLRIDGKTPTKRRLEIVDRFNSPTCVERVLLLSSKAGGTGLNLIGANFLVLFDIDWNPAIDAQELCFKMALTIKADDKAHEIVNPFDPPFGSKSSDLRKALARVWREGQKRRVHLIRLITADGLEERILQRQIAKSSLVTTAMSSLASATSDSLSLGELKELFQPPSSDSVCWTHDLMGCCCQGISNDEVCSSQQKSLLRDEDDTRAFQLGGPGQRTKAQEKMVSTTKGLGQIKTWNHFLSPEAVTEATPLMAASKRHGGMLHRARMRLRPTPRIRRDLEKPPMTKAALANAKMG